MRPSRNAWIERLRALLGAPLLPGASELRGDDDQRRLEAHLAAQCASFARFIATWSIVVNLLWWPFDVATVDALPGAVEGMRSLRTCVLVASVAALLVLGGRRELRGVPFAACVAIWCVELGAMSASMATIGDFETPWFHFLHPLVITSIVFPVRLSLRVAFASALGASLFVGFVATRPSALGSPFFGSAVSYLAFSVGVAIAYGHRAYLVARHGFLQQLDLERSQALIEAQREGLQSEVEARTVELRGLAEHLDRASELERRRIARELHDDLGQSVSAVRLALATTLRRFARAPTSVQANLEELDELVRRVADGTRDTITRLRPRILEDRGLVAAAEWLVRSTERHSGLACELRVEGGGAPPEAGDDRGEPSAADEVSSAAFRILQEALTNVQRHARASRVEVDLRVDGAALSLRVRDDGVGLRAPRSGEGMGLLGMRERARSLGGELAVGPAEGGGTLLSCTLPLAARGGGA
ncbi:MAG: sensor histidine kinase [Polyangiales bacterium]